MPEQRRDSDEVTAPAAALAGERAAVIETAIQQAIRAGEFDDLPGAGKPLPGLTGRHDPDWWIRRKIETERLTGLGPAAFTLRTEDTQLNDRLDRMQRESEVRGALDDFNRRVREARMQLLGGPPVVTPLREVDAEIAAWRQRRAARATHAAGTATVSENATDSDGSGPIHPKSRFSPKPWWRRSARRRSAR
nr:DUF1992 domain-containing protein [Agromyces archimandritae]